MGFGNDRGPLPHALQLQHRDVTTIVFVNGWGSGVQRGGWAGV